MPEPYAGRLEPAPSPQKGVQYQRFQPPHLKDVELPRFGLIFLNHLIGEFDSFTGRREQNPEAYDKAAQLKEIYVGNIRPLTWGDLAAFECLTLELRRGPELRERFWSICGTEYLRDGRNNPHQKSEVGEYLRDEYLRREYLRGVSGTESLTPSELPFAGTVPLFRCLNGGVHSILSLPLTC
jgi:hypothetical protein